MSQSRLTPNELFDYAFYHIIYALQKRNPKYDIKSLADKESNCYAAEFIFEDQTIVLMNAVSDYDHISHDRNAGTALLLNTLTWIENDKFNKHPKTYIVPLAQCHHSRRHWTGFIVRDKHCFFFDPKNEKLFLLYSYSLDPLQKLLKQKGFKLQQKMYVGCQSDPDNTYCGYYMCRLIGDITQLILEKNFPKYFDKIGKNIILKELIYHYEQYYPLLFDPYYQFINSLIRNIRGENPQKPPPELGVIALNDSLELNHQLFKSVEDISEKKVQQYIYPKLLHKINCFKNNKLHFAKEESEDEEFDCIAISLKII